MTFAYHVPETWREPEPFSDGQQVVHYMIVGGFHIQQRAKSLMKVSDTVYGRNPAPVDR